MTVSAGYQMDEEDEKKPTLMLNPPSNASSDANSYASKDSVEKKRNLLTVVALLTIVTCVVLGILILKSNNATTNQNATTKEPSQEALTAKINEFHTLLAQNSPEARSKAISLFGELRAANISQEQKKQCRKDMLQAFHKQADELRNAAQKSETIPNALDISLKLTDIESAYNMCKNSIAPDAEDAQALLQKCDDDKAAAEKSAKDQAISEALSQRPTLEAQLSKWRELAGIYEMMTKHRAGVRMNDLQEKLNEATSERKSFEDRLIALDNTGATNVPTMPAPENTQAALAQIDPAAQDAVPADAQNQAQPDNSQDAQAQNTADAQQPADAQLIANAQTAPAQPDTQPTTTPAQPTTAPAQPVVVAAAQPTTAPAQPTTAPAQPTPTQPSAAQNSKADTTAQAAANTKTEPANPAAQTQPQNDSSAQQNERPTIKLVDTELKPVTPKPANAQTNQDKPKTNTTATANNTQDKPKTNTTATANNAQDKPTPSPSSANKGSVPTGKLIADANAAMQKRDFSTAVSLLEQATKQDPGNSRAWLSLAKANEAQGKLPLAASQAEKSCNLAKSAPCYVYLGNLQSKAGMTAQAQAAYKKALELDPNNAQAKAKLQ